MFQTQRREISQERITMSKDQEHEVLLKRGKAPLFSHSESVGLGVECGDVFCVLLSAVVVELVLVVRQCLELLDDLVKDIELLLGEDELFLVESFADDLCTSDTCCLCTEVVVVTEFGDCLCDLPCVVLCEDVSLRSTCPVGQHVKVPKGLLLTGCDCSVHE